jgi:hypothetical protein
MTGATLIFTVGLLALALPGVGAAQEVSPAGRWQTYDDKTGDLESIVVITEANGMLTGHIEKIYSPPAPSESPLCEVCSGALKNKPVVGMRIMWEMKKNGGEYTGGRLFHPREGKTYRGKVRLVDGGRKLEVRGFIGFSLLGRTQTWVRE